MRWRKNSRHRVEEALRKNVHTMRTRRSPLDVRPVFKSPQTTLILLNSSIPILSLTAQREAPARHDRLQEKEQKQSFRTLLREEAHQDVSSSSTRAEKWVSSLLDTSTLFFCGRGPFRIAFEVFADLIQSSWTAVSSFTCKVVDQCRACCEDSTCFSTSLWTMRSRSWAEDSASHVE